MTYNLSDFAGRYHSLPNVLLDFLTSDEYKVFALIYSSSKQCLCDNTITFSMNNIKNRAHMGKNKIKICLDALQDLNVLKISEGARKTLSFQINWDEIHALDIFSTEVSYDGMFALYNICRNATGLIPFSHLQGEQLEEIRESYSFNSTGLVIEESNDLRPVENSTGLKMNENIKTRPVDDCDWSQNEQNHSKSAILRPVVEKNDNMTGLRNVKIIETRPVILDSSSHFFTKSGDEYTLNVVLSNSEQLLIEIIDKSKLSVALTTGLKNAKSTVLRPVKPNDWSQIEQNCPKTAQSETTVNIYKYNNKNKEERSSSNIGGENKSFSEIENDSEALSLTEEENDWNNFLEPRNEYEEELSEDFSFNEFADEPKQGMRTSRRLNEPVWKETRDLSLECYDEHEIELIMENSQFYTSSEEKLIRLVWNDIAPLPEELENEDNEQADLIPVDVFNRALYSAWEELKEQGVDFQLTEKQSKDIFGFDVVLVDNEFVYKLTPSKIRKLKTKDSDLSDGHDEKPSRSKAKKKRRNHARGAEGRRAIALLLESIDELSSDINNLTAAEMTVHLITQRSNEGSWVAESGFVHKPNEELSDYIQDRVVAEWSEQSGLPVDKTKALLKKLPHRGNKTILAPFHLFAEDIVELNEEMNEDSEVERLWKKKMAEEA